MTPKLTVMFRNAKNTAWNHTDLSYINNRTDEWYTQGRFERPMLNEYLDMEWEAWWRYINPADPTREQLRAALTEGPDEIVIIV